MNRIIFASLLSVAFLTACSEDDAINSVPEDDPALSYDSGFFVTNEGAFGGNGGTVSFVSNDLGTVEQEIFAVANPTNNLGLGSVVQSMFFYQENAYIISNVSNVITIVNRYSFEYVGEIIGELNAPRYGAVVDGKAYITNQASWQTSDDDFITVINLQTLEVENTIMAHASVEYILEEDGKLYVQNASFGTGNQVSVIDPMSGTISQSILVGDGLNSIEIDDNILYALTSTKIQTINLSTYEVSTLVEFPEIGSYSNLEIENDNLYYTSGNSVYSMAQNATEPATSPLFSVDEIGVLYGFSVDDNRVYMADGGDFTSGSSIYIYDIAGSLVQKIPVGVAPNGFYFND